MNDAQKSVPELRQYLLDGGSTNLIPAWFWHDGMINGCFVLDMIDIALYGRHNGVITVDADGMGTNRRQGNYMNPGYVTLVVIDLKP